MTDNRRQHKQKLAELKEQYNIVMYFVGKGLEWIKLYHRYEVVGMENFPREGAAIIVGTHSFATYDSRMLGSEVYLKTGRMQWSMVDRLFFKIPYLREVVAQIQWVEGSREAAKEILRKGECLWVLPGGMREALRSSRERYQIRWQNRKGFVRLALETQSQVVLAACPAADDIFTLYSNPVTNFIYRNFKVPLAILRGRGTSFIPKPVKLIHMIDEPIFPPKIKGTEATNQEVDAFHAVLEKRMRRLIEKALNH